jgi:uncharacterized protein
VVVDAANVLSAESVARVNRIAFDVHAKARGEIAMVTVADIGDQAPSDVALAVIRGWGVGAAANLGDAVRNAGTVILIVPKETNSSGRGQCRIETGYGTEGFITDAEAASFCREATPLFVAQNYSAAAVLLAARVADRYATEYGFELDTALAAAPPVYRREPVPGSGGRWNQSDRAHRRVLRRDEPPRLHGRTGAAAGRLRWARLPARSSFRSRWAGGGLRRRKLGRWRLRRGRRLRGGGGFGGFGGGGGGGGGGGSSW